MQAHPLSSTAARITSTSLPASSIPAPPRTRVTLTTALVPVLTTTPTVADSVGLAHDAGNFLAALSLYSDLLSAPGVLRPEHKHYAAELCLISNRSSTLILRLLNESLARSLNPAQPENLSLLPPPAAAPTFGHAAVMRNLAPVLQRIAEAAIKVSVTCPESLPPLDFPPEILERITVNLVRNAAEAIRIQRRKTDSAALPHCGHIQVSLAILGSELQLTVEDNGPGMVPAMAAAFLDPSPLPQGAHHGIGHRIVHQLVSKSAGELTIRVLPGNGTLFSLKWRIPATRLTEPRPIDVPTIQPKPHPKDPSNC